MASRKNSPDKHIVPLNMNRLQGRMLRYPARNRSVEILLVGDLGADLEYWWGLVQSLHDMGSVTQPDLPGIGGMDSFYKIRRAPSLDNYADYLASFIKLRYRRRKTVAVGVGFGFVVLTRTLEKYPELQNSVKLVISLGGYADHDDYVIKSHRYYLFLLAGAIFSRRWPALLLRLIAFTPRNVRWAYKRRLAGMVPESDLTQLVDNETQRLMSGDLRTLLALMFELTRFTNCEGQVELPLYHVGVPVKNLDWRRNEQHLRVIYTDFHYLKAGRKNNRYPLKRDKRSAAVYLPAELKRRIRNA